MSPDLNFANVSTAASALQFPCGEPVEIFQAELFTILEKLASGAPQLSVEDELEEMESLDDDPSANLSANDEANPPAWVNARPVLGSLPEFRTALSLNCSGRLEASASDQTLPEDSANLMESASLLLPLEDAIGATDRITREPKSREALSTHGLPEHDSDGDLAFAAEISQAEVEHVSTVEEVATDKQEDAKREPARQSLPQPREHRHTGGGAYKEHTGASDTAPQRNEFASDAAVAAPKLPFEPPSRPESNRDAATAVTTPPLVESSEPIQKASTIAQQPLREFSMGIVSDQTRVGIQVRESEGTLQVSVRTPDAGVSAVLQQNLEDLAATLSKQGMDAQFWTPAEDHRIETRTSDNAGDPGQSTLDWQGQGNGSHDSSSQQRQNQRSRFAWLTTFTNEQDAEGKDIEVTSWPFSSQISPTRR